MTVRKKAAERVLVLRSCQRDMTSYGGFTWPTSGPVEAPDWNPEPKCGGGLHGLLWGCGDGTVLHWDLGVRWIVVSVEAASVVEIDRKVKFPRGEVVFCGDRLGATAYLDAHGCADKPVVGVVRVAGDGITLVGGDYATITGGDHAILTGGHCATLTGGDYATITGGHYATLTGDDCATLTGGHYAKLSGGHCATLTGGHCATLTGGDGATLTGGHCATLTGGDGATLSIAWWEGKRRRIAVAYVGENGIKPGVPYKLDDKGKFVRGRAGKKPA